MRSIVVLISLDEAEATGSPLELVQAHDHPLHLAALAEELVDLLLRCVEAHVAHIERGAIAQERGVNIIPSRCDKICFLFSFLFFAVQQDVFRRHYIFCMLNGQVIDP